MDLHGFLTIASYALLAAVVATVLHHHWRERYGGNHY